MPECQGGVLDPGRPTWRPPFSSRALSCPDEKPLSLPSIWRTFDLSLIPQAFIECLLGAGPCTGCPGTKTPLSFQSSGGDRCGLNTHKRRWHAIPSVINVKSEQKAVMGEPMGAASELVGEVREGTPASRFLELKLGGRGS